MNRLNEMSVRRDVYGNRDAVPDSPGRGEPGLLAGGGDPQRNAEEFGERGGGFLG